LQCRKLLNNHRKVTADAEYKAVYRIKGSSEGGAEGAAYLITWYDEDGTVLKKDAVVAGTILEYKGEEPKKEGFAFAGWNSEIVTAVKDTIYTAVYKDPAEDISFTVSFDAVNGTEVNQVSVKSGSPVEKPKVLVKAGYTFTGWFNGKNEYDLGS
jgi:hypothetical protein